MARCASVAVTATDCPSVDPEYPARLRLTVRVLLLQSRLLLDRIAMHIVRRCEDLTDLAFAVASNVQKLLGELDRFFLRVRLKYCEAANQLLRFGERTIGHRQFPSGEAHAGAQCA